MTVDAVVSKRQSTSFNPSDLRHADELAKVLGLDVANYWAPTVDGFISKMRKGEMVRALNEVGDEAAKVAKLPKAGAITATARAIDGTRWLPKTLQVVGE